MEEILDNREIINEIAEKYYDLIISDKKYYGRYKKKDSNENDFLEVFENMFFWRKLKNKLDIISKIELKNKKLLSITDYYYDELYDLLIFYFKLDKEKISENKIEQLMSSKNLNSIIKEDKVSNQIKDCIELYFKSNSVCIDINTFLIS